MGLLYFAQLVESQMKNIHFNKPKELFVDCLRCGLRQKLLYDAKAAKEPTTKVQRARFNKRFDN